MDNQEMNEQDLSKIFEKSAAQEQAAFELFCNRFDAQFPMPELATVRLMQAIGWQFVLIMIQSVFAIILAALRTSDMFYTAASSSNVLVKWGDAIAAVVAVEFGIVVFATIKAEVENRKAEITELAKALNINVNKLQVGIIVGVIVSVIAGLGTSFKGFGVDVTWFKWALAIVMGAGASIIAWVSGDILGAMLARFGNARTLADLEYRRDMDAREEKKRGMWEVAPERGIARSELMELKEMIRSRQPAKTPRQPKVVPQPAPQPKTGTRSNEVRQRIYAHLDRVSFAEQRVPGPTELMKELGVAKSYASGVIKDWMALHPEFNIPTSETEDNSEA
jgi:hypothetical protein